jgi:hypothetical protein
VRAREVPDDGRDRGSSGALAGHARAQFELIAAALVDDRGEDLTPIRRAVQQLVALENDLLRTGCPQRPAPAEQARASSL